MKDKDFDDIKLLLESASRFPVKKSWGFNNQRWRRFQYAIPELKLAVEIEESLRLNISELEKYNIAQMLGWTVLRYTPDQRDKMFEEVRRFISGDKVS